MTVIISESDADSAALDGQRIAVIGYGNQGRSWALNLRDSGNDVVVCVRADPSRDVPKPTGSLPATSREPTRPMCSAYLSRTTSSPPFL